MSSKKKTDSTSTTSINYNQAGLNNYNAFQGTIANNLNQYATDPLKSTFFQQRQNMASNNNALQMQRNNFALFNNLNAGGFNGNAQPFTLSQLAANSRALSAANSNSFMSNLLSSEQARQWATSQMQNFQPLQTGQTTNSSTTTKSSGVGTWLPQVAGAALGAFTGGLGSSFGGMFGGGGSSASNWSAAPPELSPWAGASGNSYFGKSATPASGY